MQVVRCNIQNCGFRSASGFCLNRVICINEQGICKYLTKPGWDRVPQPWEKSTYIPPEQLNKIETIGVKDSHDEGISEGDAGIPDPLRNDVERDE